MSCWSISVLRSFTNFGYLDLGTDQVVEKVETDEIRF